MKKENINGIRFNFLVVEKWDNKNRKWKCRCECGNIKYASTSDLKRGHIKSCGCKFNGKTIKNTHGSRIYNIWYGMIKRCTKPNNKDYKNYGAKGIRVCDEWLKDYTNFYNWAINNGYKDNLSIDRIDNNGNYEPNNCRWATLVEQHRNYSQNRNFTINGETKCLTEWCIKYNINLTSVTYRLNKGMTIIDALTNPINKSKIPKKYRKE